METELEKLIVTLTGEASEYMGMMQQAQTSTQQTVEKVEKGAARIEELGNHLKSFASAAMSALATLGLSIGIAGAFSKFNQMEEGIIRLNVAIESNGGNVQAATAQYVRFAEQIERTTELSKGQVIGMIRQAETMGMAGAAAERTTRFAIGFASALQMAPEHAMTLAIAMERGNVHMLRRIPALRGITNEQELLRKAQEISNQGIKISNELSQTAAGRLAKMQQSIGKLAKEIGGLVADIISPLVERVKQVVDWLNQLDKGTRRVIAGVLLAVAVIPALTAAWGYLSTVVGSLSTGFTIARVTMSMFFLNPVGLIVLGAVTGIYFALKQVADQMGGWNNLWKALQDTVAGFWEWFKPTWDKIKEIGSAVWKVFIAYGRMWASLTGGAISAVVHGFTQLWELLKGVAEEVGLGEMSLDLDGIVELLRKVEFGILNFQKVAVYAWTVVQYYAVRFYEDTRHFFTDTLPEVTSWFLTNWIAIFTDAANFSTTVIGNLASNIVSVISNIPGLISGTVNWADVWRPLTQGFQSALGILPDITEREVTQLENHLLAEWALLGAGIDESWQEFRQRRLDEIAREDAAAQSSDSRDQSLTQEKKSRHLKLNSVLSGSAEALARMEEFRNKMAEGREEHAGAHGGAAGGVAAPAAPQGAGIGEALGNMFGGGATIWDRIVDMASEAWGSVTEFAENTWNTVGEWAMGTWDRVKDWALQKWDDLKQAGLDTWESIKDLAKNVWDNFPDWINTALLGLVDLGFDLWDGVMDIWFGAWDAIEEWFFDLLDNLPERAGQAFTWLVENWRTIASVFFLTTLPGYALVFFTRVMPGFFTTVLPRILSGIGSRLEVFFSGLFIRIVRAINNILPEFAQINIEGAQQRHTTLERRVERERAVEENAQIPRRPGVEGGDIVDMLRQNIERLRQNSEALAANTAVTAAAQAVAGEVNLVVAGLQ